MNFTERLTEIRAELSRLNWSNESERPRMIELQEEESSINEQIRKGQQAETIEAVTSGDLFVSLFEAAKLPEQQEGERIAEYEERCRLHKIEWLSLSSEIVAQQLNSQYELHNQEIAEKDETIKVLKVQGIELLSKLEEANKTIEGLKLDAVAEQENHNDIKSELKNEIVSVKRELEIVRMDRDSASKMWTEAQTTIAELQSKLEAAQKPKTAIQTPDAIAERLEKLKKANERTPDEMLARWAERNKEVKLDLPPVAEHKEQPFRIDDEGNIEPEFTNDPIPTAEVNQFQSEVQTDESEGIRVAESNTDSQTLTEENFKAALERITRLENKIFGEVE